MPAFSRFHRYFLAVGRLGSIRRAADELNISASAIDRQILRAEEELGLALFERLPSGLRLTAAGELMMAESLRWQKGLGDLRNRIEDLKGLRRGHVDIALIDALAGGFVPRIVRRIREDYPGITIGLKLRDNVDVAACVTSGQVDFGILLDPVGARDLMVRAHGEVVLGFVVRPDHPLAGQTGGRLAAAASEPCVMPAEPLALCRQVGQLEAATGIRLPIATRADNIQMLKALVTEGVGIGILTSLDVREEVARGDLAFIPITDPVARPLTLAIVVVTSRTLSVAANLVLGQIEAGFGEIVGDQLPR